MELNLNREYFPRGTNGELWCGDEKICYTIELPWLNNQRGISCVPEGRYILKTRFNEEFKNHFILKNVHGRGLILIHPANNALKQLRGCIAPVSKIDGEGIGSNSRIALAKLIELIYPIIEKDTVYLNIHSKKLKP
jgi:hypothetical protein